MGAPYLDPHERARKIAHALRSAVQGSSQAAIAAAIGVSESTVSRLLADHVDNVAAIIAHVGMKTVPVDKVCVPAATWAEYQRVYRRVLANEQAAQSIVLEDLE